MGMNLRFRGVLAIASSLALIVAACGGDDDDDAGPAATSGTTSETGGTEPADDVGGGEDVTLTLLVDNTETTTLLTEGLTSAFTELHPNVSFDVEERPGGADGDNIVKTRLSTGEMADVFFYNSGSLLQALNPEETLVDRSSRGAGG